ncbi:hypothetical protein AB0B50_00085 [Streptomyces sp. NPDC041068]|uniref:phage major capsid protein n=1 Tax=Streptomyces sp. NPDC041068 TaxID=3155130 RepID=UPI0033D4E48D
MAHTITTDEIVAAALGLLEAKSVLGSRVWRDAESSFIGGVGDEVTVTLPTVVEAKLKDDGKNIDYSDLNEQTFKVKLTDHAYNAIKLNERQMNFDIRNFGAQVLTPQASGVAKHCEKAVTGILNKAIEGATEEITKDAPLAALAKVSAEMTAREIDEDGRVLAIGPDLKEAFLALPELQNAAFAGDANVIQNGSLGRVLGFEVVVSPFVKGGAVAFTREAVALAVRAPAAPEGASGASNTHNGFALTTVRQYVVDQLSHVNVVQTFVGATALDTNRMVPLKIATGGGGGDTRKSKA